MEQEIYEPDWLTNEERTEKLLAEHEENERRVLEAYYQTLADLKEVGSRSYDDIKMFCGNNFCGVVLDTVQHYVVH